MNSSLRPERRPDRNGRVVTRHIRDSSDPGAAGRAAKLSGIAPPAPINHRRGFADFDFSAPTAPGFQPPSMTEVREGARTEETGSKYLPGSPRRASEIAKALREDLKEAVRAGWIPDGLKYAVTSSRAARTQGIRITVTGLPDELIRTGERNEYGMPLEAGFATELRERLHLLAESYNSGYSDWNQDISSRLYYSGVEIKDSEVLALEAQRAEEKRLAREENIERRLGHH